MLQVIDVDLSQLGMDLPRGEVGMVIAQPHVKLTDQEPFTIRPERRNAAISGIDAALDVALSCPHGREKTHFTIFPEYSLPGLGSFDHITSRMEAAAWPSNTVVIGGIDGLTRAQFIELTQRMGVTYDAIGNSVERIEDHHWVNCCVIWVKTNAGEVRAWVQPKIEPAFEELQINHQSMFKGNSIFVFKGLFTGLTSWYRFTTLICYDWIGGRNNRKVWEWLLYSIDQNAATIGAQLSLTWLFVTQCNSAPSHATFMREVQQFFNGNNFTNVLRDDTCLVMANAAGRDTPGNASSFGCSSVIFASTRLVKPEKCEPTYCNRGEYYRPGNPLDNFRDAVFRERGACIHSFIQLNPSTLPLGAAGKRFAVTEATVHPFPGTSDPRAPGGLVPAVVKWVNDQLDDPEISLARKYPASVVAPAAGASHSRSVSSLRALTSRPLQQTVAVACPETDTHPDKWGLKQSNAVNHILHTFSILESAQYSAIFHGAGAQATIMKNETSLEVVAVSGRTHEESDRHVLQYLPHHRGRLLLVSRDEDNNLWDPRMRTLFEQAAEPSKELNITDPTSAIIRVGYRQFLSAYQSAASEMALMEAIDAALS